MSRPIPIYHENVQEFPEETWIPPTFFNLSRDWEGEKLTVSPPKFAALRWKRKPKHRSKFARSNRLESNWNSNSTNFEVETNETSKQ